MVSTEKSMNVSGQQSCTGPHTTTGWENNALSQSRAYTCRHTLFCHSLLDRLLLHYGTMTSFFLEHLLQKTQHCKFPIPFEVQINLLLASCRVSFSKGHEKPFSQDIIKKERFPFAWSLWEGRSTTLISSISRHRGPEHFGHLPLRPPGLSSYFILELKKYLTVFCYTQVELNLFTSTSVVFNKVFLPVSLCLVQLSLMFLKSVYE